MFLPFSLKTAKVLTFFSENGNYQNRTDNAAVKPIIQKTNYLAATKLLYTTLKHNY